MENWVRLSWVVLALIHLAPAATAFAPSLIERLYGVTPDGDVGVLLIHRGVLFLAVLTVSGLAVFDLTARRVASVVAAISMIGFLIVYARAGLPAGSLRAIAWADAIGLVPLAIVTYAAWRA